MHKKMRDSITNIFENDFKNNDPLFMRILEIIKTLENHIEKGMINSERMFILNDIGGVKNEKGACYSNYDATAFIWNNYFWRR